MCERIFMPTAPLVDNSGGSSSGHGYYKSHVKNVENKCWFINDEMLMPKKISDL